MALLAAIYCVDAALGLFVVYLIFSDNSKLNKVETFSHLEDLIVDEEQSKKQIKQNDRVPKLLKNGKISKKMFTKGWKFNLFNKRNEVNKQISAISVIFLQLYLSMVEIVYFDTHQCLSIIVLSYSSICLFSFLNIVYVRDFEAVQVNITPIVLSIAGLIALD